MPINREGIHYYCAFLIMFPMNSAGIWVYEGFLFFLTYMLSSLSPIFQPEAAGVGGEANVSTAKKHYASSPCVHGTDYNLYIKNMLKQSVCFKLCLKHAVCIALESYKIK